MQICDGDHVNLRVVLLTTQQVIPLMVANGDDGFMSVLSLLAVKIECSAPVAYSTPRAERTQSKRGGGPGQIVGSKRTRPRRLTQLSEIGHS
jgi:hypothetical protein